MSARRPHHAAVVQHARWAAPLPRSALVGGLALGLIVLATSPGGAEPRGATVQHPAMVLSQPIALAVDHVSPKAQHALDLQTGVRVAALGADLGIARQEETAARAALAEAGTVLDEARDARDTALSWAEAAQEELMRARVRLGEMIEAEDSAVADLRGAVRRVEGARRGSKAHRAAFTGWQMAAVAERAAHLRRTVAARVGSQRFTQLNVAESELTDAELALGRAKSAHLKAGRAAESASARVTELEAETSAALDPPATTNQRPAEAPPELPPVPRGAQGSRP